MSIGFSQCFRVDFSVQSSIRAKSVCCAFATPFKSVRVFPPPAGSTDVFSKHTRRVKSISVTLEKCTAVVFFFFLKRLTCEQEVSDWENTVDPLDFLPNALHL